MDNSKIESLEWTLVITQEPLLYYSEVRYESPANETTAFIYLLAEFLANHPLHTLNGASFEMIPTAGSEA